MKAGGFCVSGSHCGCRGVGRFRVGHETCRLQGSMGSLVGSLFPGVFPAGQHLGSNVWGFPGTGCVLGPRFWRQDSGWEKSHSFLGPMRAGRFCVSGSQWGSQGGGYV